MKVILHIIIFLLLSGCTSHQVNQDSAQPVIAPGTLNLPVLPGSFIPADCGVDVDLSADGTFLGCVAFPLKARSEQETLFEWQYIQALENVGWKFADGLANVLYVERPIEATGCNERLALIAWLLGDKEEVAKYGTAQEPEIDWSKVPNGVIWFVLEPEQSCDS